MKLGLADIYTWPNRFLQDESSQVIIFLDFKLDVLCMLFDCLEERTKHWNIVHYDNFTKPCLTRVGQLLTENQTELIENENEISGH